MDIFEVLTAISKSRINLVKRGLNENKAMLKAQRVVSKEYHIPMPEIQKLIGNRIN
ncbi:MAG: hypothetical protein OIN87_08995 [Candidatus Methanoperedens sp.]|nr:hypothetical protein [Candidatus Methanoperedens sp.]